MLTAAADFAAKINRDRKKPLKLIVHYYFVEKSKRTIAYLKDALSKFPLRPDDHLHFICGRFESCLDEILLSISSSAKRTHRCIFLLDQYGWNAIPIGLFRKIGRDLPKSEIIATFAMDWLIDYASRSPAFLKATERLGLTHERVGTFMGMVEGNAPRALIQNIVFKQVAAESLWQYYTPFFLVSPESHRAYWLLHLSGHYTARNEMGLTHWEHSNVSTHHGRAGLRTLGFDPNVDESQFSLEYKFGQDDRTLTHSALIEEVPKLLREKIGASGGRTTLENVFSEVCNDTPAVKDDLTKALTELRSVGQLEIRNDSGKLRPRARGLDWQDVIEIPAQKTFSGPGWAVPPMNRKKRNPE